MKDPVILVWLKNDLRIHDNELLAKALQTGKAYPVFIFDSALTQPLGLGFSRIGSFRKSFLHQTLHNLRAELHKLGLPLIYRVGDPVELIPQLASQLACTAIYTSQEVGSMEVQQMSQIESRMLKKGVLLERIWQNTLYHIEDIPWPIQHLPHTFTDFRKEIELESRVRNLVSLPACQPMTCPVEEGILPAIDGELPLSGGETEALKRLHYYLWESRQVLTYKETRDNLQGNDSSSRLSPWLANGSLSPRQVYFELQEFEKTIGANESTYWLYFELLWRDFFRFTAKKFGSRIFQVAGIGRKRKEYFPNTQEFRQWCQGETGVPLIDALMNELRETGFLSNRGRQIAASFLARELEVDWTWGAAWYEANLVDYDVASNWLNWAYLAGVGNDPREDRKFNLDIQQRKFDPDGSYIQRWSGSKKSLTN